jgi:hypothetical protein
MGQDGKLRHKPVTFVSAGYMEPLKELEVQQTKIDQSKPSREKIQEKSQDHIIADRVESEAENASSAAETLTRPAPAPDLFIVDTSGDKALRPKKVQPVTIPDDHESDPGTDSSEEVILFKGRDGRRQAAELQTTNPKAASRDKTSFIQLREMDVEIKVVEKTITANTAVATKLDHSKHIDSHQPSPRDQSPANTNSDHANDLSLHHSLLDNTQSDEEAAIIADYIANMGNSDDDSDDNDEAEDDDEKSDARPGLGSHAFHMLRDLGGTDSDAVPGVETEDESSEVEPGSQANVGESSEAQRHRVELEDERMARILAKQDELGLGSDDIVLFDGADTDDGRGEWKIAPKSTPRRTKKGSAKKAKIIQKKGQYPSATEMATAFDDIDLMDWHRAALDTFNQATKRASGPPHVSDSELEEAMNLSFQKDRLKKAEKKKQREALRVQGLLGKKVRPDDLRVKYPAGMSPADLESELEQFLAGTDEQ